MDSGIWNGLLIASGALWVLAIGVLVWAWRGRRVGDHPYCVGCGFDLVGVAESWKEGVREGLCSECGADVAARGAVVVGERLRRWRWLAVAGVVNGVLLLGLATLVAGVVRGVDWIEHEPLSWVARRVDSSLASERVRGMDEIKRRLVDGEIGREAALGVADRLLARQGDLSAVWSAAEGDFLVYLRTAGLLDDERMRRFARQAVSFSVEVRAKARRGDPWPMWLRTHERAADMGALSVVFSSVVVMPDGKEATGTGGGRDLYGSGVGGNGGSVSPPLELARLREGPVTARVRVAWEVFEGSSASGRKAGKTPLVSMSTEVPLGVMITPTDDSDLVAVREAGLAERLRACVSLVSVKPSAGVPGRNWVTSVTWTAPPADLAMEMWVRRGSDEVRGPTFLVRKGERIGYSSAFVTDVALWGKVDVVFRPKPELIRGSLDLFSYADVQVVVKDLDTGVPPPAGAGATTRP